MVGSDCVCEGKKSLTYNTYFPLSSPPPVTILSKNFKTNRGCNTTILSCPDSPSLVKHRVER